MLEATRVALIAARLHLNFFFHEYETDCVHAITSFLAEKKLNRIDDLSATCDNSHNATRSNVSNADAWMSENYLFGSWWAREKKSATDDLINISIFHSQSAHSIDVCIWEWLWMFAYSAPPILCMEWHHEVKHIVEVIRSRLIWHVLNYRSRIWVSD